MYRFTLLQVSDSVVTKSAEMAAKDPHGVIITIVSVSVVFAALILLYFAYMLIGKAVNADFKNPFKKRMVAKKNAVKEDEIATAIALALNQELNSEAYAAISLALHKYLEDTVHDNESYIITIKRK